MFVCDGLGTSAKINLYYPSYGKPNIYVYPGRLDTTGGGFYNKPTKISNLYPRLG